MWRRAPLFSAALPGRRRAGLEVKVLSSAPELVSGNDALIRTHRRRDPPVVTLNGRTSGQTLGCPASSRRSRSTPTIPPKQLGLIHGFQFGPNECGAQRRATPHRSRIIDHDINGTLFAGPQDTPFLCELDALRLQAGQSTTHLDPLTRGLRGADEVAYYYRNTAGKWKPFDAPAARPTDIDKGANGQPMIIRQEIGVINRAAYVITIPHDPAAGPSADPDRSRRFGVERQADVQLRPGRPGDGHHQGRGFGG